MTKIPVTFEFLQTLYETSKKNDRLELFTDLLMDWAKQANDKIIALEKQNEVLH